MILGSFIFALISAYFLYLFLNPGPGHDYDPDDRDYRSDDEKHNVVMVPRAVSNAPGMSWDAAIQELHFNDQRVRRKAWPVGYVKKGTVYDGGDGSPDYVVEGDYTKVWHIWHDGDAGEQTHFGGLLQGWGGQIGAENDDDDFVMVCGEKQIDGRLYSPSMADLRANDWEVYR